MFNQNEHRNIISADNEYSDSNCSNQGPHQSNQMELEVPQMVPRQGENGEIISDGYFIDGVYDNKGSQIHFDQTLGEQYRFQNQINKADELLDAIVLSDDEETPTKVAEKGITEIEYNNEMRKIGEYYEEDESMNKYTGTKNEVEIRKEIPVAFELTDEEVLIEAGMIDDMFEDKIIIRANILNGILDLDNILFNENKFAIGYLDDVIGKIESPFYVLKFFPNITKEISQKMNILPGSSIYFARNKSTQVATNMLVKQRGCDASNAFDEEINDDELEFSDDEEELQFKSKKKNRNVQSKNNCEGGYSQNVQNFLELNYSETNKKRRVEPPQNNKPYGFNPEVRNEVPLTGNYYGPSYSSQYKIPGNFTPFQNAPNYNNNMNNYNMLNFMMNQNQMINPMLNPMLMNNQITFNPMMQNYSGMSNSFLNNMVNNQNPNTGNTQNIPSINPFLPPNKKD